MIRYAFRRMSNKTELLPAIAGRLSLPAGGGGDDPPRRDFIEGGSQASVIRYNVCKEQSSPGKKFVFETRPVITMPDEESKSLGQHDIVPHNPNSSAAKGYRIFESSTTQKNVTLPLKYSKLSSPFPEPVKVMPSHQVSDMEKADQAQAEFKVPRAISKRK